MFLKNGNQSLEGHKDFKNPTSIRSLANLNLFIETYTHTQNTMFRNACSHLVLFLLVLTRKDEQTHRHHILRDSLCDGLRGSSLKAHWQHQPNLLRSKTFMSEPKDTNKNTVSNTERWNTFKCLWLNHTWSIPVVLIPITQNTGYDVCFLLHPLVTADGNVDRVRNDTHEYLVQVHSHSTTELEG